MASPNSQTFLVKRNKAELIAPSHPTPREIKQLSDIDDQGSHRFHLPLLFFYEKDNSFGNTEFEKRDHVKVVKEAIGKALVFYYPLAGRLIEEPNGELTMDCTAKGVLFINADADVSLHEFGKRILPPCPFLEEFLCDVSGSGKIVDCPLLMIQVTCLSCGGFVVAVQVNHAVSDALGVVNFLTAVAELARGLVAPTQTPRWKREIFNARFPPIITHRHLHFKEVTPIIGNVDELVQDQESIIFGEKEIKLMSKHLPPFFRLCSMADLVMACLWKARTIALQLDPNEVVSLSFMINVDGVKGINIPKGYYGNSFVSTSAIAKAENLCKNHIGFALGLIMNAKDQVKEEYIRSLADYVAVKGRPKYSTSGHFIISDMTHVGFGEVDFGWGRPVYGGPAQVISPFHSPLARLRSIEGEEKIVLPICLPAAVMEKFKILVRKMVEETTDFDYAYEATSSLSKL